MAEKKSILLRIDPRLWEELQRWADDELRSLNGQMEWILREAVRRHRRKDLEVPQVQHGGAGNRAE
ncbi:MAG TPA: Arc family DNA binding domain-containing protein [bacterium]|nr:Arc family DNA binding domain-containing protein [bacterium]HQI49017.1 Arc family DNA binding domain-containing protein [bacterium]HQJ63432.1 Arc family DNA binding domain-containing protein [bacterium]